MDHSIKEVHVYTNRIGTLYISLKKWGKSGLVYFRNFIVIIIDKRYKVQIIYILGLKKSTLQSLQVKKKKLLLI